jgi:hypothetical protein
MTTPPKRDFLPRWEVLEGMAGRAGQGNNQKGPLTAGLKPRPSKIEVRNAGLSPAVPRLRNTLNQNHDHPDV